MLDVELSEVDKEISLLIRANFPIIYIFSYEEKRVLRQLEAIRQSVIVEDIKNWEQYGEKPKEIEDWSVRGRPIIQWSCTNGFYRYRTKDFQQEIEPIDDILDPLRALDWALSKNKDSGIYVFQDFHPFVSPMFNTYKPAVVRKLRDLAESFRSVPKTLILLSPVQSIPIELTKDVTVLDYPLPTAEQLNQQLAQAEKKMKEIYGDQCIDLSPDERSELMQKSVGLTSEEVKNVWAKALERDRKLSKKDIEAINEEKQQIIHKSGLLEYYPAEETFAQVGGLEGLKSWLRDRKDVFTRIDSERKFPPLKGILLIGIPGCGKSLSAKAVAGEWQLPLIRLDVGKIYDPLLGKTDENFRNAIKIVEGLAPVVFWIDEVEKGFPQTAAVSDSGTSMRVLGSFLSWMQEKTQPVFVVATANDIERMPWELTRKGRFDEIFYVGMPTQEERKKIFEIHLGIWGLELAAEHIEELANKANHFTGAEIEQVVKNSLWSLSSRNDERQLLDVLEKEVGNLIPLAQRLEENTVFQGMQRKAKEIAKSASGTEPDEISPPSPKLSWRI